MLARHGCTWTWQAGDPDTEENLRLPVVRICSSRGWILDERVGDPETGIAPGTRLVEFPSDWSCPECRAGLAEFEPFLDAA